MLLHDHHIYAADPYQSGNVVGEVLDYAHGRDHERTVAYDIECLARLRAILLAGHDVEAECIYRTGREHCKHQYYDKGYPFHNY